MCNSCAPVEEFIRRHQTLYKVVRCFTDGEYATAYEDVVAVFNGLDNAVKYVAEKMMLEGKSFVELDITKDKYFDKWKYDDKSKEEIEEFWNEHESHKLLRLFEQLSGLDYCPCEVLEPLAPHITYEMCKDILINRIWHRDGFIHREWDRCDYWKPEQYVIVEFKTKD